MIWPELGVATKARATQRLGTTLLHHGGRRARRKRQTELPGVVTTGRSCAPLAFRINSFIFALSRLRGAIEQGRIGDGLVICASYPGIKSQNRRALGRSWVLHAGIVSRPPLSVGQLLCRRKNLFPGPIGSTTLWMLPDTIGGLGTLSQGVPATFVWHWSWNVVTASQDNATLGVCRVINRNGGNAGATWHA